MTTRRADDAGRRTILDAIRRNLAESAPFDAVRRAEHATPTAAVPTAPVDPSSSAIERFATALEAVGGHATAVADEEHAAEAVREILEAAGARRVALSDAPLAERVAGLVTIDGLRFERDPNRVDLFDCDAGITTAQWAIAETGTLVLDAERERHRLASLVPPVHVAIVDAAVIRDTLAEVLRETGASGREALSRTLTFVTGPSRTSDIELTLAIGVHGPGALHVVVVGAARRA